MGARPSRSLLGRAGLLPKLLSGLLALAVLAASVGMAAFERRETLETALDRAEQLCQAQARALGAYALQASIAACHARATTAPATDWARIAALYDALAQTVPSPVVELNRAVAVSMAFGPQAGLEILDALRANPALKHYPWLYSARGDMLSRLGRHGEACTEFEHAATLTQNARERELLLARAQQQR